MAKGKALKRAPGFLIGQWKKEAIAANPAASDEALAKNINETAKKQGYDYTITPEKVRSKTTQPATASKTAPMAPKAKELKRPGGRMIGMWKQQVVADNPGASDEELANIIHELALTQGFDYTIRPEKVRTLTRPAQKAAPAPKEAPPAAPAPRSAPAKSKVEGALLGNLSTFVGLVGKEGAKDILENMIDRL